LREGLVEVKDGYVELTQKGEQTTEKVKRV